MAAKPTPAPTPNEPPPSLLRKLLRIAVIVTVVLVVAVLTVLLMRPEALLFQPTPTLAKTPADVGLTYERVEIPTEDGETLVGWYLDGRPADGVIIYCHGNAGNIGDRVHLLPNLRELGRAVLMFDYRGYGESTGRPTVAGTRLDIQAVWDHLIDERHYEPDQIVLWGRSLGGAIAIDQAARASERGAPPRAVIVESSFTSTLDLGKQLYPWLPVRLFGRKLDYPSVGRIASIEAPVLVAHSGGDDLIPVSHGRALFEAARSGLAGEAVFIEMTGGHNDIGLGAPRYKGEILAFLAD